VTRTILTAALLATCAAIGFAQTKTIPGEMKTATATVESIDRSTREVTLKKENGEYVTIVVPPDVKKFDAIQVGDRVTTRYYDNVVLRLKPEGEKAEDTSTSAMTGTSGTKPGGTAAVQRTITATITNIDPDVPSITFTGPNNWVYSSRVQDRDLLKKVKVGDRVDITWTEAVMISLETPPK
jgi:Cu/Ag efflux protein CusF